MRRLTTFPCMGETLVGSLDLPDGASSGGGVLFVTGGLETRFGSHRLYERLAARLTAAGHRAFRYDRRGTGDSDGEDPGYLASGPDIAAALAAFRAACPDVGQIAAFGLCDGATALALHAGGLDIGPLVLANPWMVERRDDLPPAAAIGARYRAALADPAAWRRALGGGIDLRKAARGLARLARPGEDKTLATAVIAACLAAPVARFVIAEGDATGRTALAELESALPAPERPRNIGMVTLPTSSHSFAEPEAFAALLKAIREVLEPLRL